MDKGFCEDAETPLALDPDGLTTSVTDGNSHTTSQTFDADGRPLVTTKANGDTFTNSYDGTGQKGLLSSTTDGNSHTTSYSYTARDQKSGASYPDSTSEGWTNDANGVAATISFLYNGDDLRVGKTDSAGTSAPTTDGTEPANAAPKGAWAVYTPGISERTTAPMAKPWNIHRRACAISGYS